MLRLPPVELATPRDLTEALDLLASRPGRYRVLAGGTDLLVALKHGHHTGTALLSLRELGLGGIRRENGTWVLGASVTLWELARWQAPSGPLSAVARAARLVAAPPIQGRATLGGNVCLDTRCWFYNQSAFWRSGRPPCRKAGGEVCHVVPKGQGCHAVHQADLPPLLVALGARADIRSAGGERRVDLEDLYRADGLSPLALEPGELLTALRVPTPPRGSGASYHKLRMRRSLDFAAAAAAVYLERDRDTCTRARVVLGALGSAPIRVGEAERALEGSRLDDDALESAADAARRAARPVKNTDLTPAYRRHVAGVLVKRAAREAWEQAGSNGRRP